MTPSAKTDAINKFSVAPTEGNSKNTSDPINRSARPFISPCSCEKVAPSCSSPFKCISMGRDPKSSPPGIATRARPILASNGPSTTIEARIRSTKLYGAIGSISLGTLMSTRWPVRRISTPMASNNSIMIATSVMSGTLTKEVVPSASSEAAISLRALFFAPPIRSWPSKGPLPRTRNLSISPVCSSKWRRTHHSRGSFRNNS